MIICLKRINAICFLSPVLEKDIITTINNCKSKTSCDHNSIDMVIIN